MTDAIFARLQSLTVREQVRYESLRMVMSVRDALLRIERERAAPSEDE